MIGQTRHLERKREARQKGELEKLRESIQKDRKRGSANLFSFPSSCFVSLPGHPPPVPGLSSTTVFSFPGDRLWQVRRALTVGIYRCYDAHSINGFFPRRLEGCFSGAFYVPLLGGGSITPAATGCFTMQLQCSTGIALYIPTGIGGVPLPNPERISFPLSQSRLLQ